MTTPENQQAYTQGYHAGYQHGLQAAQQAQGGGGATGYPINLVGRHPERSSRLLMFFWPVRFLALIPHIVVLYALNIATGFVLFAAWFVVVFTGNYPEGMWNFMLGVMRWQMRVGAYGLGLTDEYPPFALNE